MTAASSAQLDGQPTSTAALAVVANAEFGTAFTGRSPAEVDHWITVDRTAQLAAIACHRSQSTSNRCCGGASSSRATTSRYACFD